MKRLKDKKRLLITLFNQLGNTKILGFKAMLIALENYDGNIQMVNGLYVQIAKELKSTPSKIERNLRYYISSIWNSEKDKYFIQTVFYYDDLNKIPSISNFIASVLDFIKIDICKNETFIKHYKLNCFFYEEIKETEMFEDSKIIKPIQDDIDKEFYIYQNPKTGNEQFYGYIKDAFDLLQARKIDFIYETSNIICIKFYNPIIGNKYRQESLEKYKDAKFCYALYSPKFNEFIKNYPFNDISLFENEKECSVFIDLFKNNLDRELHKLKIKQSKFVERITSLFLEDLIPFQLIK